VEDVRVTAEDAGGRAGRIEQDGVDLGRRAPAHDVRRADVGAEPSPLEILAKSHETTFGSIDRRDLEARRG
jgi:hypothetical protein